MAIYKPSNFYPNLQEVDMEDNNTFSCQVNTNGSSIKAYKIRFLSEKNASLYESTCINLANPVKNQGILQVSGIGLALSPSLLNGKNYKWGIRTYDAVSGSAAQPSTVVCSGFLVGSTKYVFWTTNNERIEQNRWIEFNTTSSNMMPILQPNEDNLVLPTGTYRERQQISWVTSDLGFDKNITKIETGESFKYNYIDGTTFTLFPCSDKHGYGNVFVNPNDNIQISYYLTIYNTQADANAAHAAGENPATATPTITPRETARKIVGYSSDTGEIRVQESFLKIPENGNAYLLYSYNSSTKTYTEEVSKVSQLIGGSAITDATFIIKTNKWDATTKQLFIQPNINIKSDATNPNEIVFDSGERVDIIQKLSTTLIPNETTDITIDKLDNTQWLLTSINSTSPNIPIIPKSTYTIYTDFIDSSPDSLFYGRKAPTLTMQFKNYTNLIGNYENIIENDTKSYRDISFCTLWNSIDNVQIKYYKYILYDADGNKFAESENFYNNELTWFFRGFQSGIDPLVPQRYSVQIIIKDEYNKEFTKTSKFKIYYDTQVGLVPLGVQLNCKTKANEIIAASPLYVETTNDGSKTTVTYNDVRSTDAILEIKKNQVLNYTKLVGTTFIPYTIPDTFSFLTQFQITGNFIDTIPVDGEQVVLQWGNKNINNLIDTYTLKLSSFASYYVVTQNNTQIIQKNANQFKLKLYKNADVAPLTCFNNGTKNFYDISVEDEYQDFKAPLYINYALQSNNDFIVVDSFPLRPDSTKKYILTQDIVYEGKKYYKGVYTYNNFIWKADTSIDYIFVDKISQVPDYTYDTLKVPANCRDLNGNLIWTDTGNIWVDTNNYCTVINKIALNKKWFLFYFVVKNGTVQCEVTINSERVE